MDNPLQSPPRAGIDAWIEAADNALKTLSGAGHAARPVPASDSATDMLPEHERRLSAALMRVNHVGEICAQALYNAQRLTARETSMRAHFEQAARDETDHLAWTRQRMRELQSRPSLLNPLWYAGAFGIGWAAGRTSQALSLGFVVETERQVEAHLQSHLDRLPAADHASRAIVQQMKIDEARHADEAEAAGAATLAAPVRWLMRVGARVMTTTAHYL